MQIVEVYLPENTSVENLIRESLQTITENRNLQYWREDPRVKLSLKEKLFCLLIGFIDGPTLRPKQLTGGDRPSDRFR
jgi:hypothetical protein